MAWRRDRQITTTSRLGQPLPRRVVVLRALQLGDLLCAVPAFRALRAALPQAEIALLGLPWAGEFVARFDQYLDTFIELPGFPGLPERPADATAIPPFLAAMQAQQFDLAVQLHGNGSLTNPLLLLLGARHSAGFYRPGDYCPDPLRFLPYPEAEPEVRRGLRLLEFLGVPLQGEALEFPLSPVDEAAAAKLAVVHGLTPGGYVCLHPGARAEGRRWPPTSFAAIGDRLSGLGLRVILTGASSEARLTRAVAQAMRSPVVDLAGQTTLGALGCLVRDAALVISNDTGISHVAAALRVPSVVIFTNSDPARWAPLDQARHRPVDGTSPSAVPIAMATAARLLRQEVSYVH